MQQLLSEDECSVSTLDLRVSSERLGGVRTILFDVDDSGGKRERAGEQAFFKSHYSRFPPFNLHMKMD